MLSQSTCCTLLRNKDLSYFLRFLVSKIFGFGFWLFDFTNLMMSIDTYRTKEGLINLPMTLPHNRGRSCTILFSNQTSVDSVIKDWLHLLESNRGYEEIAHSFGVEYDYLHQKQLNI